MRITVVRIAVRLDEDDLMEARSVGTKDAADSYYAPCRIESIKNKAKIIFLSPHYSCSLKLFDCYATLMRRYYYAPCRS